MGTNGMSVVVSGMATVSLLNLCQIFNKNLIETAALGRNI